MRNWRGTLVRLLLIFVLPCAVITMFLVFSIGNVKSLKIGPVQLLDDQYTLRASFDDVSGMLANDNVKVAGVVVGKVTKVKVIDGRAEVTFKVKDSVKLPSDSRAAVRWRNLLGQRYLYVYPGEASTVLEAGDRISKTRSVVDLGELFNRLGPIVKALDPNQVNAFLDAVVGALDGNESKLRQALDDLAVLAGVLGERDLAIGRLVENIDTVAGTIADRDREIRTILDNLVAISTTFNENTDVLDQAVTELTSFSDNLGTLLTDNRAEVDRIIDNLSKVIELVRTKLPTLDDTVLNLDDAAKRLFNASRYGEWLNQDIFCGTIGYPVGVSVECDVSLLFPGVPQTPTARGASPASPPVRGAAAVVQLLGGIAR